MAVTFDRPKTIFERLKDVQRTLQLNKDGSRQTFYVLPGWYNDDCKEDGGRALRELCQDAIDEIEMHQKANGYLMQKLGLMGD